MDGFTLLFLYGMEFLSPFPKEALPIIVTHRKPDPSGPIVLTETWTFVAPNTVRMDQTEILDGKETLDSRMEYRLDDQNNITETIDLSTISYPFSHIIYDYADGHPVKATETYHLGEPVQMTFAWEGSDLIRSTWQTQVGLEIHQSADDYQWQD